MEYIISVDGGGSNTRAVLCDREGNCIASDFLAKGCNPNDIGIEETCNIVLSAIKNAAKDHKKDIVGICCGISGISVGDHKGILRENIENIYPDISVKVVSDIDIAYANGLGNKDGCLLLSGTGVVGYSCRNGIKRKFGGYGFYIDHGGSGYDFARDAYYEALCSKEGIGKKTILTEYLEEKMGCTLEAGITKVYSEGRGFLASLAPIVFTAAKEGDEVALDIIKRNAGALSVILKGMVRFFCEGGGENKCPVILAGSIFKDFSLMAEDISNGISNEIEFIFPKTPAVYGGFRILRKEICCNSDEEPHFKENFINSYTKF